MGVLLINASSSPAWGFPTPNEVLGTCTGIPFSPWCLRFHQCGVFSALSLILGLRV